MDKKEQTIQLLGMKKKNLMELEDRARKVRRRWLFSIPFFLLLIIITIIIVVGIFLGMYEFSIFSPASS
jgi:hypothetical protein